MDLLAVPRNLMMRRIRAGAFHVLLIENVEKGSCLTVWEKVSFTRLTVKEKLPELYVT